MASYLTESPAATRALNRAPISRVRTGCLTCRARKKKCDERKPRCHGCERNYITCRWPPHVHASMYKSPSSNQGDERQELQHPEPGRNEFICDESFHSADGRAATNTSLVLNPPLPMSAGTRGKDGRAQVLYQANSIRYSERRQSNVGSEDGNDNDSLPARSNYDSVEQPISEYNTLKILSKYTGSSPQVPRGWATIPTEPTLFPGQPPSTFYFLSHYLHRTANHLVNGASPINPFLAFMVPLAFSSELIHQLLLTQSAAHWARRSRDRPDIIPNTHYAKSLRLFRGSINNYIVRADGNVILLGVGALTLCFIENVRGDTAGTIYDHLLAAKTLLIKILSDTGIIIMTNLRCFLIEYYIYTATLSMISTDARISDQCLLTDELVDHAERLVKAQYVGNMCGCWLELLLLIPSIFNLGRRWLMSGEVATLDMNDMTQFTVIQHKVLRWKSNTSVESDVTSLGLIYQQAMLLYLYTAASSTQHTKNEQYEELIETAIAKAMGYMRELQPTAPVNTNMCWPIAIIGSLATNSADQQEIRNRLETMNVTLGFGNILQVLTILEDMWQHPSDQAGPWNICIAMQKLQIWISFS